MWGEEEEAAEEGLSFRVPMTVIPLTEKARQNFIFILFFHFMFCFFLNNFYDQSWGTYDICFSFWLLILSLSI